MNRSLAFISLGFAALAACAPAASGPATTPDKPVSAWTTTVNSGGSKAIEMRNNTHRPIRITRLRVYACENTRDVCVESFPNLAIARGQTKEVGRIERLREDQAFSFRYDYSWELTSSEP